MNNLIEFHPKTPYDFGEFFQIQCLQPSRTTVRGKVKIWLTNVVNLVGQKTWQGAYIQNREKAEGFLAYCQMRLERSKNGD